MQNEYFAYSKTKLSFITYSQIIIDIGKFVKSTNYVQCIENKKKRNTQLKEKCLKGNERRFRFLVSFI